MNFLKIKLLVIALVVFAASSAFAALAPLSYDVTVDTASLNGSNGYLYLQYNTGINQVGTSTATVQNFGMDGGALGATAIGAFANSGNNVTGTLPGSVSFTNGIVETNDYNQAITFGNNFHFSLLLPTATSQIAGSTFSLWLAADAAGAPLKTADGMLFNISLNANGTASTVIADADTTATPTPIPAAFWLLGSGLMGLAGSRRKGKKQ
jgi:hypothetical protein